VKLHRPLSPWVARYEHGSFGPINDGDERSDARESPLFAAGWQRVAVARDGQMFLGLSRVHGDPAYVELDDYSRPIEVAEDTLKAVIRVEQDWPVVREGLDALADAALPLRFWLLTRLDAEGDPPDPHFALLPWELVDRAADVIAAALESGARPTTVVEIRHWLTPAAPGIAGPLEQLGRGLRDDTADLTAAGTETLLANLRDLPLGRIPGRTRQKLGTLVRRLGPTEDGRHAAAAVTAERRLRDDGELPGDLSSLVLDVVPISYLDGPTPRRDRARLTVAGDPGSPVTGRLALRDGKLHVTLTGLDASVRPMTVAAGPDGSGAVPLQRVDRVFVATVRWTATDLPLRLVVIR
jgi:hypothetical protein